MEQQRADRGERGAAGAASPHVAPAVRASTAAAGPRRRFPWVLVVAFVAIVAVVGVAGYGLYRQQASAARTHAAKQLASIGELKASEISRWAAERRADMAVLRDNEAFEQQVADWLRERPASSAPPTVVRFLRSLARNYNYSTVAVLDHGGRLRYSTTARVDGGVDDHALTDAERAQRTGKVVFMDLHIADDGRPAVDFVVPLVVDVGGRETPAGALYLRIDPARFLYPLVQTWPVPSESSETLLVRREGDEVVFLNELRSREGTALVLRMPLDTDVPAARAALGTTGLVEGKDYRGVDVLADVRPVPGTAWFIVAKVDRSEILAGVRREALAVLIVTLSVIVAIGFGILLFWRARENRDLRALYEGELARQALGRHYESLTHYANDIILLTDERSRIVDANERALETYGYARDELVGMSVERLLSAYAPLGFEESQAILFERGAAVFESEHRRKDGTCLPVESSSRVIEIEGHRFVQTITRDISERRAADAEIRRQAAFITAVLDTVGALVVVLDRDGAIVSFNDACEALTGYTSGEIEGKSIWETLLPAEVVPAVQAVFEDLADRGLPNEFENEWLTRSGERRLIAWSNTVIAGDDGEVDYVIGTGIDVTEQRRAERALRESEERFRSAFENAAAGMSLTAPDGRLLRVNQAFAEMVGRTVEEMHELDFATITHPDDLAESHEVIRSLVAGERASRRFAKRYLRKDGGVVWANVSTTLQHDDDGAPLYFITFLQDVTEEKRAAARVERLSRLYRVLSAINEAIVRIDDRQALLSAVCSVLVDVGGLRMSWVGMRDGSTAVTPVVWAGHVDGYLDSLAIDLADPVRGAGPTGRALSTGEARICNDIAADPAMAPWREAALACGYRSSGAFPLRLGGTVVGALMVYADQPGYFAAEDVELLEQLAADLSYALGSLASERRRLEAERALREHAQRLEFMREVEHAALTAGSLDEIAVSVVAHVRRHTGADRASMVLLDVGSPKGRVLAVDTGMSTLVPSGVRVSYVASQYETMRRGECVVVRDLRGLANVSAAIAKLRDEGFLTIVSVPLIAQGELLGAVNLASKTVDGIPEPMIEVALEVSAPVAQTIRQVRLREEIRAQADELERRVVERTGELQAAMSELESFSYSVSHDLRAPLRVLDDFSLALIDDYAERLDGTALDYLNRVRAAAQRMGQLIDDLLELSRVQRSKMNRQSVELSRLACDVVDELRRAEPERAVEFVCQEGVEGVGDSRLLRVVLVNLIGNAWKFTSKQATARVEFGAIGAGGDPPEYFVRDDGVGFDMAYADKLFTPFERLHTSAEFPGTGVGLATVRRIVHRHGGRVWVESELGEGTTVFFTLTEGGQGHE